MRKKFCLRDGIFRAKKGVLSVKRLQTYWEEKEAERYNVYSAFYREKTRGGGD